MPLINFQTDLTNLPWGRDKRDSGDSNQPYITKDIPTGLESDDLPVRSGPDFIVRGGLKMVTNAVDDVSRLFKMFTDTKNLSAGIGFIAKQNILSRTSVKTPASFGLGYAGSRDYYFENTQTGLEATGGGNINQGVYTPIGTLATALGNGLGVHANLLGLDPFSPMSGVVEGGLFQGDLAPGLSLLGLNTYEAATKKFNETADGNRLVIFNNRANEVGNNPDLNVYSYSGGPGAVLGIGKTNIKFADQRTGVANNLSISSPGQFYLGGVKNRGYQIDSSLFKFDYQLSRQNSATAVYAQNYLKTVFRYQSDREFIFNDSLSNGPAIQIGTNGPYQNFVYKVNGLIPEINEFEDENGNVQSYTSFSFKTNPEVLYKNSSRTYSQPQLIAKENVIEGGGAGLYPTDFRKELYDVNGVDLEDTIQSSVISLSPNYRVKNIDERLNMGHPGNNGGRLRDSPSTSPLKNVWNYGINATELEALDKITAMPMYTKTSVDTNQPINDLVKFRIAAINNNKTNDEAVYMHFRAFIDSFDDSYSSTWNSVNYVGRGDTLYNYGGFTRNINLSFTVAAQSKAELIPMYKKLNYLASQLTPDYNGAGFMRGNLVRLTLGGYLYEQPGFINSLTYTVPQESNWEIGIDQKGDSDHSVKELPHVIQVSGFSFTPIHKFLPEKPGNANNPNSRFIALSNKKDNRGNYNDEYRSYQPTRGSGGDNNEETNEPFREPQNLS